MLLYSCWRSSFNPFLLKCQYFVLFFLRPSGLSLSHLASFLSSFLETLFFHSFPDCIKASLWSSPWSSSLLALVPCSLLHFYWISAPSFLLVPLLVWPFRTLVQETRLDTFALDHIVQDLHSSITYTCQVAAIGLPLAASDQPTLSHS